MAWCFMYLRKWEEEPVTTLVDDRTMNTDKSSLLQRWLGWSKQQNEAERSLSDGVSGANSITILFFFNFLTLFVKNKG